jgi:hypothetical protein
MEGLFINERDPKGFSDLTGNQIGAAGIHC